jgi:DnaJ-class molecular chaperone
MSALKHKTSSRKLYEEIPCAFCHGQGTDPYGLLSDRSICSACSGRRVVKVVVHHVGCAYCKGSGSYKTYRCPVCEGSGVMPALQGPTKTCPSCDGDACESSNGLVCLTCRGRGVLPV